MKSEPLTKKQAKILADHYDYIKGVAFNICNAKKIYNPFQIEDCQSFAVLRAIDAILRYDKSKGTSIKTWICIKVVGAAKDWIRQEYFARRNNIDPDTPWSAALSINRRRKLGLINCQSLDDIDSKECSAFDLEQHVCGKDLISKVSSLLGVARIKHSNKESLDKKIRVFCLYFFCDYTLREAAEEEGVTESRAHQMINYEILPKLMEKLKEGDLR